MKTKKPKTTKSPIQKKLNLKSRRTKLIAIMLIVALLGGGYFVYKSYAGTTHRFTPPANGLMCGNSACIIRSEQSKTPFNVWELTNNGYLTTSNNGGYYPMLSAGNYYRYCVYAKGNAFIRFNWFSDIVVQSPTAYTNVCSNWKYQNSNTILQMKLTNLGGTVPVRIQDVRIEAK